MRLLSRTNRLRRRPSRVLSQVTAIDPAAVAKRVEEKRRREEAEFQKRQHDCAVCRCESFRVCAFCEAELWSARPY